MAEEEAEVVVEKGFDIGRARAADNKIEDLFQEGAADHLQKFVDLVRNLTLLAEYVDKKPQNGKGIAFAPERDFLQAVKRMYDAEEKTMRIILRKAQINDRSSNDILDLVRKIRQSIPQEKPRLPPKVSDPLRKQQASLQGHVNAFPFGNITPENKGLIEHAIRELEGAIANPVMYVAENQLFGFADTKSKLTELIKNAPRPETADTKKYFSIFKTWMDKQNEKNQNPENRESPDYKIYIAVPSVLNVYDDRFLPFFIVFYTKLMRAHLEYNEVPASVMDALKVYNFVRS